METIEEKAKAYAEALIVAKQWYNDSDTTKKEKYLLKGMFSELTESEDERIRKWIIGVLSTYEHDKDLRNAAISWLEKQANHTNFCNKIQIGDKVTRNKDGVLVNLSQLNRVAKKDEKQDEQKVPVNDFKAKDWYVSKVDGKIRNIYHSVDKVEPKFKIGDWISGYYTNYKVLSVNNNGYVVEDVDGNKINILFENEKFHQLWTIQDAKDGDVLVASDNSIFLFKGTIDCACKHYVALTTDGAVKFNEGLEHYWETSRAVHPATKEQRNLLFQKMKEAGYEWDAKKKELKKIEQNIAWNENDKEIWEEISNILWEGYKKTYSKFSWDDIRNWLKPKVEFSKCRVQPQSKQEWSEEDEIILTTLINYLEEHGGGIDGYECIFLADWLKSIRPQNRWKPSEEQIEVLKLSTYCQNEQMSKVLFELYQDLKNI